MVIRVDQGWQWLRNPLTVNSYVLVTQPQKVVVLEVPASETPERLKEGELPEGLWGKGQPEDHWLVQMIDLI